MKEYELVKATKKRKTDNVRTLANLIDLHDDAPEMIPGPFKKFTRQECVAMLLSEVIDLHRGQVTS